MQTQIASIDYGVVSITYHVEKDQKIAQLVVAPVAYAEFEEVAELSDTTRGEGGFGSMGLLEFKKRNREI